MARTAPGTADPVKPLLNRHRALCEDAVDPLEIAAALEVHGITDRAALSRFRHRDVFALAEELYARVPHDTSRAATTVAAQAPASGRLAPWMLVTPAPGLVAALTLFLLDSTGGGSRLAVTLTGAVALSCAVAASLRHGPLRAEGRRAPAARLWVYWLLAYAVYGDGLLTAHVEGGSGTSWSATPTSLVALSFAVAPAAWCAHLFSLRARRGLSRSRDLADFAASTRPVLLAVVALYACALTGIALLVPLLFHGFHGFHGVPGFHDGGDPAHVAALATLLLLARLLTVHGYPAAAAAGLAAACAVEALACLSVLVAGVPGCAVLGTPVAQAVHAWGAGAVPAFACGAAAAGLVCHAAVSLARASAHT
ncbi:hypothetical protein [Streptomyces sp. NRRL F-5126]|uniref:hypothetical protein n=1 Tax=Streptomyces sp. NRRL F-5126 TaxID=1463857 RepID=UPI000A9FB6F0|nr:hypothetical protein [Streptomyces sp. NRRL F-5126]